MLKIFADERQQLAAMIETPDLYPIVDRDFKKLLMMISKEVEGGFDGKIRFPSLEEEFIKGKLDKKIFKVDVGPLLLAIGAKNTKAVSLIL